MNSNEPSASGSAFGTRCQRFSLSACELRCSLSASPRRSSTWPSRGSWLSGPCACHQTRPRALFGPQTAVAVETWTSNLEIVARSSFEQVVIHSREELILLSSRVWRGQELERRSGWSAATIARVTHSLVRVGQRTSACRAPRAFLIVLLGSLMAKLLRSSEACAERLRTC